jgi:hypothetical protein
VILGDGPIEKRFTNLPSYDGQTITFLYDPPAVKTMSEADIRSLPAAEFATVEQQVKDAGISLSDLASPYKGVKNEQEFEATLSKGGASEGALYHYFWVQVQNKNGIGVSHEAIFHGIRDFPFDHVTANPIQNFFTTVADKTTHLVETITPKAEAQVGGGIYSFIFVCTCSGALVTANFGATGGGILVWQTGQLPMFGSCRTAGNWLGYYLTTGGICPLYIGYGCITLTFGMPLEPFACNT